MEEVFIIKKSMVFIVGLLGILLVIYVAYGMQNKKYVDVYSVVKDAFLTDKGYTNELSKHMNSEVFNKTNIYNVYAVNEPNFKKPFKIDFSLEEVSQRKLFNIVLVKMIYSVEIKDLNNQVVGGSRNIPITFIVRKANNEWYIFYKSEKA
jgi:hypothetical protein